MARTREEVINLIKEYEKAGGECFFTDVEDDPPFPPIKKGDVDYLKKSFLSKIRLAIASILVKNFEKKVKNNFQVEVLGADNLKNINGGAIITSNHFSVYENMAVKTATDGAPYKHKFWAVIREGNYYMPGTIGYGLKNYRTLPLSSDAAAMIDFTRAIDRILSLGDWILVYPEQAMWWNYRKPRIMKNGAFRWAAKNGVPVIPCFVTMENLATEDKEGFYNQKYIINVLKPIYPDVSLTVKQNAANMQENNYCQWVEIYEQFYKIPLAYDGSNFIEKI